MDSDINADFYKDEDAATVIERTKETVRHSEKIDPKRELIEPIITPRFAPSCSSAALHGLAALAKEENLPIQTHIAENHDEIALVRTLFHDCKNYTDVYASHGLLTHRTVLGHAIHLNEEERAMVKDAGAAISHCPISNSYLSSGLCPVRELLDLGINVGLGTDISGGWSPSVLVVAREALGVSRVLAGVKMAEEVAKSTGRDFQLTEREDEKVKPAMAIEHLKLSVEEVLYLATVGGAKCLGLEGKVGTFEVGKEFDAQMIDCGDLSEAMGEGDESTEEGEGGASRDGIAELDNPVEIWGKETWSEKMAKWVFCGDDRNVWRVWVRGRKVHERAPST